jgi:cobalt-zinc-cadmium efflux system outer membrane protein
MKTLSRCCKVVLLVGLASSVPALTGAPPAPAPEPVPPVLARDAAVRWALEHNPELAALRQQHGIAAAGVVIARTYPFNPVWEAKVRAAFGPESAGVTNSVSNEHKVLVDVEIRNQGRYRRQAAGAALSRADWDIVSQETALAIRTVRAFDAVVYRYQKRKLIEKTIELNNEAAKLVALLVKGNKLKPVDEIIIGTEVQDARAQLSGGNLTLAAAWNDLRRALGLVEESFDLQGELSLPPPPEPAEALTQAALEVRADLHSRRAALAEAEARLRFEIANRYGNPNVGPAQEYDPTRISLIGVQFTLPLPVFNTHRGEILQRRAERDRAGLEVRQTEVLIRQDVHASLVRLERARQQVNVYQRQVLPNLETAQKTIRELFEKGDPSVDLLRFIDVQRKLLKARDVELDALWELRQAQADLAAAVGDPALVAEP